MAHDFENVNDLEDLNDDEIRELVENQLGEHNGIDPLDIEVTVEDGIVRLAGRVGTEEERRIADHVLTDVVGVSRLENELLVDPIRRGESPEAMAAHSSDESEHDGLLLGDRAVSLSPEAEHMDRDLDDMVTSSGTSDPHRATEMGAPWIPPERPTPEGMAGSNPEPPAMDEDH
ncbi:MAG: BON domain-containing protein [Gemmatimonadaceae bacterium]